MRGREFEGGGRGRGEGGGGGGGGGGSRAGMIRITDSMFFYSFSKDRIVVVRYPKPHLKPI